MEMRRKTPLEIKKKKKKGVGMTSYKETSDKGATTAAKAIKKNQ